MSSAESATRDRQVLAWRAAGLTYARIGARVGVSANRASDLHRAARHWQRQERRRPQAPRSDRPLSPDMLLDVHRA